MDQNQLLSATAAAVFLLITLLAAARGARRPLARDLGLMGVSLFAYNLFELLSEVSARPEWDWLEDAAAAGGAVPTLRLFLGFVGKRTTHRRLLRGATAYFFGIAAFSLSPFVSAGLARHTQGALWALLMLAGLVPCFGIAAVHLVRHARSARAVERARSRVLIATLVLGVGGVTTDLVSISGLAVPRLSFFGMVASGLLLTALALRAPFLDAASRLELTYVAAVAASALGAELAAFHWFGTGLASLVTTAVLAFALVLALRPFAVARAEERERARFLTTLGRFSQQMTHDLKNPVAAIRGAAQLLEGELDAGRPLEPHRAFLELIVERTERIERIVTDYQRMGRVEPRKVELDLADLVRDIVPAMTRDARIELELDLPEPVRCRADPDLIARVLENLVKNSVDAMAGDGRITASARRLTTELGATAQVTLQDDGPGMDPRVLDQAFEEFYTTKEGGTGLGLPFVARVVEAHGGRVHLDSEPGRGTAITIELPAPSDQDPAGG